VISLGKSTFAAEIHWQLVELYHDNVMNHLHGLLHDTQPERWQPCNSSLDGSVLNPLYSPDLAPNNSHIFGPVKEYVDGHSFKTDV